MTQLIARGWHILRQEGYAIFIKRTFRKLRNRFQVQKTNPEPVSAFLSPSAYLAWIEQNEPGPDELAQQAQASHSFSFQPLISILTPVYNLDPQVLYATVASIKDQSYPFWELCLVDGASTRPGIKETLQELAAQDSRIHLRLLEQNLGISGNSNAALEMAQGEFIALLDHDDLLAPFALYEVVKKLNVDASWDVLYSDHDLISSDGARRYQPLFKPDWSPEIMLSANYITHLTVLRSRLVREVGGFNPEMDGAQDWDLFLRLSEKTQKFAHIPHVLYHWRQMGDSTAEDIWAKPYAPPAQLRAITRHLASLGLADARAFFDASGYIRVAWALSNAPKVSIIIPTNGANELLKNAIHSILVHTHYTNYEIIIVNNGKRQAEEFPYYQQITSDPRIQVLHYSGPFNYNTVNNTGAQAASGDLLLFLNNDVQVFSPDWLDELVLWAMRPEVGAVGAKLLFPDGKIQHAGAIIGLTGFAGHIFSGLPENQWTIFGLAEWYRDFLAVTAACLMVRREVFERLGRFDEIFLLCGSDVELCLRLRAAGLRVVYNPFARLKHLESATRGGEVPADDFRNSYPCYLPALQSGDPYFNPNLSYWHPIPTLSSPGEPAPLDFVNQYLLELESA